MKNTIFEERSAECRFNAPDTEIGLFDAGYTVKKHYANEVTKAIHFKSNVPDAIRHLIIERGLSIKEIEIGVNQIIETEKASGNTQAEIDFKDWKKYAEGIRVFLPNARKDKISNEYYKKNIVKTPDNQLEFIS